MVVNVFLFDDFEVMDAFGPVQVFGCTPEHFYIRFISMRGGLINGKQGMKVWTEPLNPLEIEDIFLIPGGKGVKSFLHTEGCGGIIFLHDGPKCLRNAGKDRTFIPQTGGRLCI